MRADRASIARWLERLLLVVGVVCVTYYGLHVLEARHVQREQAAAFAALLESAPVAPVAPTAPVVADRTRGALPDDGASASPETPRRSERAARTPAREADGVMALLEIPRLRVSSTIMSGDSEAVLDVAIGHLPDTPKPWEPGNSALAAHRDGLFRPLRGIRVGDEIRVRSPHGDLLYRVSETKVVVPTDLSVLQPRDAQTLTLITCYPFNFVGNAPKRFIVHADRVEAAAISTQ